MKKKLTVLLTLSMLLMFQACSKSDETVVKEEFENYIQGDVKKPGEYQKIVYMNVVDTISNKKFDGMDNILNLLKDIEKEGKMPDEYKPKFKHFVDNYKSDNTLIIMYNINALFNTKDGKEDTQKYTIYYNKVENKVNIEPDGVPMNDYLPQIWTEWTELMGLAVGYAIQNPL